MPCERKGLTLDKLMSKARALEASEQQAKVMEETSDKNTKINYVSQRYQKSNLTRQDQRKQQPAQQDDNNRHREDMVCLTNNQANVVSVGILGLTPGDHVQLLVKPV